MGGEGEGMYPPEKLRLVSKRVTVDVTVHYILHSLCQSCTWIAVERVRNEVMLAASNPRRAPRGLELPPGPFRSSFSLGAT
jgi:hypothetical protein